MRCAAGLALGGLMLTASLASAALAQPAPDGRYSCEMGDFGVEVIRAVGTGTFVDPQFVIVLPASSEMVSAEDAGDPFVLPMVEPGRYAGPEGTLSLFDLRLTLDNGTALDCFGLDTGLSVASSEPGAPGELALNVPGRSHGGRLRAGPSMNAPPIGSIAEGTLLTLEKRMSERMNGYNWFEVITPTGQRAFQWGGILCPLGMAIDGAFVCE